LLEGWVYHIVIRLAITRANSKLVIVSTLTLNCFIKIILLHEQFIQSLLHLKSAN